MGSWAKGDYNQHNHNSVTRNVIFAILHYIYILVALLLSSLPIWLAVMTEGCIIIVFPPVQSTNELAGGVTPLQNNKLIKDTVKIARIRLNNKTTGDSSCLDTSSKFSSADQRLRE